MQSITYPTHPHPVSGKEVFAVACGAAVEFFDFSAYATFSVMIGKAFFPTESSFASLLLSLSVFGLGFLVRPLGALIIGSYADKAGRKPAMLVSMMLMMVGTGGLVMVPDYATFGIAAPLLLLVCRMLQGLAWGGEAGPATTFIMEAAPSHKRGLYTSWQIVAQGAAGISAGLIGYLLSLFLTNEQLALWGWRIPFAIGLLILPIAIYLRAHLSETFAPEMHTDEHSVTQPQVSSLLSEVFTRYRVLIIIGMLIISGSTITQYFLNYMATYALNELHFDTRTAMLSPIIVGIGVILFSLLGGYLADRWGRKITIIVPRIILTLALFPGLAIIGSTHSHAVYFVLISLFTALQCISGSGLLVALCECFPRNIRSTGFSIVYAFGITLFGGTAQVIFSWLSGITGSSTAPAYYLIVTNILCILATLMLVERDKKVVGQRFS